MSELDKLEENVDKISGVVKAIKDKVVKKEDQTERDANRKINKIERFLDNLAKDLSFFLGDLQVNVMDFKPKTAKNLIDGLKRLKNAIPIVKKYD